jgi:hypothetical protein
VKAKASIHDRLLSTNLKTKTINQILRMPSPKISNRRNKSASNLTA